MVHINTVHVRTCTYVRTHIGFIAIQYSSISWDNWEFRAPLTGYRLKCVCIRLTSGETLISTGGSAMVEMYRRLHTVQCNPSHRHTLLKCDTLTMQTCFNFLTINSAGFANTTSLVGWTTQYSRHVLTFKASKRAMLALRQQLECTMHVYLCMYIRTYVRSETHTVPTHKEWGMVQ